MRLNILIGGKAGQGINKISEIDLTINSKGLTQGYYYYNISIRSNGGDRKIPVEFDLLYTIEALKIEGYLDTEAIDGPLDNLSGILSDEEYKEIWNVDKSDNVLDTQSVMEIGQSWELYLNEYNQVFNIWKIYRGYLFFDTSSLPDVAEIKSACIKIYGKEEPNPKDFEQFDIVVQNGQPNNPHAPLEDIDYNRLNYQQNGGKLPISDYKVDSYNTIHLNENW